MFWRRIGMITTTSSTGGQKNTLVHEKRYYIAKDAVPLAKVTS